MELNLNIEDLNKTGIYLITNVINNKKYIGSTCLSFKSRLSTYKSQFKNKTFKGGLKSWNNLNQSEFRFEILEIIEEEFIKNIFKRERYWIEKLDTLNSDVGYNLILPAKINNSSKDDKNSLINQTTINIPRDYLDYQEYWNLEISKSKSLKSSKVNISKPDN